MNIVLSIFCQSIWTGLMVAQVQSPNPQVVQTHHKAFAISWRDGFPVIGAELTSASYPTNNYNDYIQKYGPVWKEQFDNTPELVIAYRILFFLQGEVEKQINLCAPKWMSERIRSQPVRTADNIPKSLASRSFAGKFAFGPYIILLEREYDERLNRFLAWPIAVRKFDNKYRFTAEWDLSNVCNYVATFVPFVDARSQKSRYVDRDQLLHLERFEIALSAPLPGERKAHERMTWNSTENKVRNVGDSPGSVSLYCRPIVSLAQGYGSTLEEIATSENIVTEENHRVCHILQQSLSSKTIAEKQTCWHSSYAKRIAKTINEQVSKRRRSESEAARKPFRASIHVPVVSGARLIASIDCGVGFLHFFRNPSNNKISVRDVVGILEIQEHGSSKLASSFSVVDKGNIVEEMFLNEEFKGALLDYVQQKYPAVYERIEE